MNSARYSKIFFTSILTNTGIKAVETTLQARLIEVIDTHFDPRWGSAYWLARARELMVDPLREIITPHDLEIFGRMRLADLATHPVEDFIPRRYHDELSTFVTSESGGTTGAPSRTAFSQKDFRQAFVDPFIVAADAMGFPRDENWLFIGPSGPHIIAKAARECAIAMGSIDPFMVDFDPRWIRKLPPGSFAHARYVEHIAQQAQTVLTTQHVGVLFATPPILTTLGNQIPRELRESIRGIHLGGLPSTIEFLHKLGNDWFPNATVLGGYGNSLAGMCPQLSLSPDGAPEYFPHGNRLAFEVRCESDGERGQVVFHRIDHSGFLPNVFERDEAELIVPQAGALPAGFDSAGLRDPRPPDRKAAETGAALY